MIDPTAKLSVSRQAIVLGISRGSVYYKPRPVSDADLKLMHRIDKLHMEFPFAGSRMLQGLLVQEGFKVGRLHVATLMKRMGIEALYRRPNTSKPAPGHKIYPYLLRKLPITRPNQVWAMDITYIPMARGFIYLAAVLDWFTRRVLAWRVSITLEAEFCMEAVEEALARTLAQVMQVIDGKMGRALARASDGRAASFVRADYAPRPAGGAVGFTPSPYLIADETVFGPGVPATLTQASLPAASLRPPQRPAMSQVLGATFGSDSAAVPPQVRRAYDRLKALGL